MTFNAWSGVETLVKRPSILSLTHSEPVPHLPHSSNNLDHGDITGAAPSVSVCHDHWSLITHFNYSFDRTASSLFWPGSGLSGFLSPLFQLLVGIKNARWAETLSQSDIPSDKQPQPCLLFTLMTPERRESQHHGEIFFHDSSLQSQIQNEDL